MNFVRNNHLPVEKKNIHTGPCPDGYFWALEEHNDLPETHVSMSVEYALEHSTVYIQNAEKADGWKKVSDPKELEVFHSVWEDDPLNYRIKQYVLPYMPEFYLVPHDTIDGYKIRTLSGDDLKEKEDLMTCHCPKCEEETYWGVSRFPRFEIYCLYCNFTVAM